MLKSRNFEANSIISGKQGNVRHVQTRSEDQDHGEQNVGGDTSRKYNVAPGKPSYNTSSGGIKAAADTSCSELLQQQILHSEVVRGVPLNNE